MEINCIRSSGKLLFTDRCFGILCRFSNLLLSGTFVTFFLFTLIKGVEGLISYGFGSVFGSLSFNLTSGGGASFWSPMFITLLIAFIVILFSIPCAQKCAVWLAFTKKKKTSKTLVFLFELLSYFPSIFFGLFGRYILTPLIQNVLSVSAMNVSLSIIIMFFMCVPVITTIFHKSLNNNKHLVNAALALGANAKYSIYKVVMPQIRTTVSLTIAIVFGKVISESIAFSFLLSSSEYATVFKGGFLGIFNSQLLPMAPLISSSFFADGVDDKGKNLLFAFSFMLLTISYVFNSLVMQRFLKNQNRTSYVWPIIKKYLIIRPINGTLEGILGYGIDERKFSGYYLKSLAVQKWTRWTFFNRKNFPQRRYVTVSKYVSKKYDHGFTTCALQGVRKASEIVSICVVSIFGLVMLFTFIIKGIMGFANSHSSSILSSDGILRALTNSLTVGIISIYLAAPLSFFSAIYLSEYCQTKWLKKHSLIIYNIANSTPAIIFGVFGSFFFISKLGMTVSGTSGNSLIASILVMVMFISYHLVRIFYNIFQKMPIETKKASYSLGMNKYSTFFVVILPTVKGDIYSSLLSNVMKIMGETVPFILTSGLSAISTTNLMSPGQTLTTRIAAEMMSGNNMQQNLNNMFQCVFLLLILVAAIVTSIKFVIPCLRKKHI